MSQWGDSDSVILYEKNDACISFVALEEFPKVY